MFQDEGEDVLQQTVEEDHQLHLQLLGGVVCKAATPRRVAVVATSFFCYLHQPAVLGLYPL